MDASQRPDLLEQVYRFATENYAKEGTVPEAAPSAMVKQIAYKALIDPKIAANTPLTAYYDNRYARRGEAPGFFDLTLEMHQAAVPRVRNQSQVDDSKQSASNDRRALNYPCSRPVISPRQSCIKSMSVHGDIRNDDKVESVQTAIVSCPTSDSHHPGISQHSHRKPSQTKIFAACNSNIRIKKAPPLRWQIIGPETVTRPLLSTAHPVPILRRLHLTRFNRRKAHQGVAPPRAL